jgi:hypothetical protein
VDACNDPLDHLQEGMAMGTHDPRTRQVKTQ